MLKASTCFLICTHTNTPSTHTPANLPTPGLLTPPTSTHPRPTHHTQLHQRRQPTAPLQRIDAPRPPPRIMCKNNDSMFLCFVHPHLISSNIYFFCLLNCFLCHRTRAFLFFVLKRVLLRNICVFANICFVHEEIRCL